MVTSLANRCWGGSLPIFVDIRKQLRPDSVSCSQVKASRREPEPRSRAGGGRGAGQYSIPSFTDSDRVKRGSGGVMVGEEKEACVRA